MRSFEFEEIREHCLDKMHTTEGFPFDGHTCVWKVNGKIFAVADLDEFSGVTLKCDPERAVELREQFQGVIPGWHTNKNHWNTVLAESDVSRKLVLELIDHSYDCVIRGFSKKQQKLLGF